MYGVDSWDRGRMVVVYGVVIGIDIGVGVGIGIGVGVGVGVGGWYYHELTEKNCIVGS